MVKFIIQKIKFGWNNKPRKIIANIRYNTRRKMNNERIKYGIEIIRTWSFFCNDIKRDDTLIDERQHKYYTPIKQRIKKEQQNIKEQTERLAKIQTREERRKKCLCKEKCKEEFQLQQCEMIK